MQRSSLFILLAGVLSLRRRSHRFSFFHTGKKPPGDRAAGCTDNSPCDCALMPRVPRWLSRLCPLLRRAATPPAAPCESQLAARRSSSTTSITCTRISPRLRSAARSLKKIKARTFTASTKPPISFVLRSRTPSSWAIPGSAIITFLPDKNTFLATVPTPHQAIAIGLLCSEEYALHFLLLMPLFSDLTLLAHRHAGFPTEGSGSEARQRHVPDAEAESALWG